MLQKQWQQKLESNMEGYRKIDLVVYKGESTPHISSGEVQFKYDDGSVSILLQPDKGVETEEGLEFKELWVSEEMYRQLLLLEKEEKLETWLHVDMEDPVESSKYLCH